MDAGIARGTMTQVGPTIKGCPRFTQGYPQGGGMTTETIAGEDIRGTIREYLTRNFSKTGEPGKRAGIGRSSRHGVSRV